MRRSLALAIVLLVACNQEVTRPPLSPPTSPARATSVDNGPPRGHHFGRDHYRIGVFTGQGTTAPGLSCGAPSNDVRECTGYFASAVDSTRLDVTVQVPVSAPKPVPLVALVHGYGGSKTSSGDIADSLLRQGYAVLRYSTRGFGDSWGQVNMVDVHAEVGDLRSMIAQLLDWDHAATPPQLDPDRVAVTGASYGGGHSWMAALQPNFDSPGGLHVHIRTVVPIAAWSDLLYALVPNGRERASIHRPGGAKLSFINALYLSGWRPPGKNPSRPHDNYPEYFKLWHAWINAQEPNNYDPVFRSAIDGLAGYRSIWWQQSFWRSAPAERLPVFIVQGFTDDLFPLPEAKRMMLALQSVDPNYPVALYLGDIGHPRASNKSGEVGFVLGLIRDWLAYYLKGVPTTSPPSGVYAALTRPRDEAFNRKNVINVPTLAALSTATIDTQFALPTALANPGTIPVSGPFWDPIVMTGAQMLPYFPDEPPMPSLPEGAAGIYDVAVKDLSGGGDLAIAGQPTVSFHAFSPSNRVQVNVRLFDVDGTGKKQLITRGTYTIGHGPFGVPIGDVDVTIATYGNYWLAPSDHTIRLELTNVDAPYITPSRIPSAALLTKVRLEVPIR
jgi:ABC-2 type transport system ATP-binding protein